MRLPTRLYNNSGIISKKMFDEGPEKGFRKLSWDQFTSRYKDMQIIGGGTFGEVFRARKAQGGLVAIKKFRPAAVQCFYLINRQTQNLRKLQHPNIVHFYDCFIVDDNKYYMVTQFCEGGTLYDWLQRHHSDNEMILACKQIAEGLAFAHQQGIVHRDLKPENILVGKGGRMKIGDFGSSTQTEGSMVLQSRVGSLAYMDMRVSGQQGYDNTCDLYSFGLVMTAIFGQGKGIYDNCFNQHQLKQMQENIYSNYTENIQPLLANIPSILRPIVENCLSNSYQQRLSAAQIVKQLDQYLKSIRSPSKIISTQESMVEEQPEKETSRFACQLLAKRKNIQERMLMQRAQGQLLVKLNEKREVVGRLKALEQLYGVSADLKSQFAFLVLFAYFWWLEGIRSVLEGAQAYGQLTYLKLSSLSSATKEMHIRYLDSQHERLDAFFMKCARRTAPLFRFKGSGYRPERFREMVRCAIEDTVKYSSYSGEELFSMVSLFLERRVKKEFNESGTGHDQSPLLILQTIAADLR